MRSYKWMLTQGQPLTSSMIVDKGIQEETLNKVNKCNIALQPTTKHLFAYCTALHSWTIWWWKIGCNQRRNQPHSKSCCTAIAKCTFHIRKKVDEELTSLEWKGITEKLDGPTPWVSPLVSTPKQNGNVRICVDMRMANQTINRERHHVQAQSLFEQGIISWHKVIISPPLPHTKGYGDTLDLTWNKFCKWDFSKGNIKETAENSKHKWKMSCRICKSRSHAMWNDDTPADQERGPCYCLVNREMYIYLHDSHFKLITDCKPVQLIFNNNPKSKRIEHWNLRVQGYDFDVAHTRPSFSVRGAGIEANIGIGLLLLQHCTSKTWLTHEFNIISK